MQQRATIMDEEPEDDTNSSSTYSRNRRNSKLKVLVRSHAMREEQSPPREPSPNILSPCIKLTPSPLISPVSSIKPLVLLSPSVSQNNSPCRSPVCVSPTSTLVPSPNPRGSPVRCSSYQQQQQQVEIEHLGEKDVGRLNNRINLDREVSSHYLNSRKTYICDCITQECSKCAIVKHERNINNNLTNVNNNVNPNTLTVGRMNCRGKLRQQSSSQGSFEGSSSNSPCLSRDNSSEQYTDTTGIDLELFIPETLNRNAKDRALMLRIEQELVNLAKDKIKTHYKFPPMSSYQRMLVHRCAAYFGMDHNIESSGKCVVVNKTKSTRIPDVEFKEHIKEDIIFSEEPRRSILKRDLNSIEDYNFKSPDRQYSLESRRSKSFEEREEEYENVRRRIFNKEHMHDSSSMDEFGWSEVPWSSTDSDMSSRYRLQPPELHRRHHGQLIKVQSEETSETLRPHVAKSYSFGGYGGVSVLSRGDSVMSTHSAGPRLLTKQDSAASSVSWRLSPSSSGYKSQSQMSESVTPSPTSTPHPIRECKPRQDSNGSECSSDKRDKPIIWAVTDIESVPKGSIIINPQTGQAIKNEDGTLYHYDPINPPTGFTSKSKSPTSPQKIVPPPYKPPKDSPATTPTKRSTKCSPVRKFNVTNSSTSPSLPYPPSPLPLVKSFTFPATSTESVPMALTQQYPLYNAGYTGPPPPPEPAPVQMFQQPCLVYSTPYSIPMQQHYENRVQVEQPMPDMSNNYYVNVPENSTTPVNPQLVYQQTPSNYWGQQPINYYTNHQTPNPNSPRYPLPVQPQPTGCLPTFGQNYIPQPPTNQLPQTPDLLPVYPNQQVQFVYSNPSNQSIYPNHTPLIYTQNATYTNPNYQTQNIPHYPQNTSTPNSCTSSVASAFPADPSQQLNYVNLSQGMGQMSLCHPQYVNPGNQGNFLCNKMAAPKTGNGGAGKFGGPPKGFLLSSSQSSTGTSSPAATVIAGYCPQNPGMYRTPPETPPAQYGYGPNMTMPSMIFRPMGNVRASTPGTARSSRSPTPASDITHYDRQRMSIPAGIYHGMPYVIQSTEARIIAGRGQPTAYRQQTPMRPQSFNQGSDNRNHKTRKSKNYKVSGLPPSGKQI